MKLDRDERLTVSINEADLVLIGIGEEWGISFDKMIEEPTFAVNFQKLRTEQIKEYAVPYLQREYLKTCHLENLKRAYRNLYSLVKDKDYFIVSMNKDRYPVQMGFQESKCVFPCGGYEMLQCDSGCNCEIIDADPIGESIYNMINNNEEVKEVDFPHCEDCGKPLVFNNIEASRYLEEGYKKRWNDYMKWLQGTVNKKLCLLELGVGMRFPTVIRWPFEKTIFYNQKAQMFRIHHVLSQPTENIQDRCFSKKEDSVTYMANLFVT